MEEEVLETILEIDLCVPQIIPERIAPTMKFIQWRRRRKITPNQSRKWRRSKWISLQSLNQKQTNACSLRNLAFRKLLKGNIKIKESAPHVRRTNRWSPQSQKVPLLLRKRRRMTTMTWRTQMSALRRKIPPTGRWTGVWERWRPSPCHYRALTI